jgi:uncharacterized iron-regulated membrane protein
MRVEQPAGLVAQPYESQLAEVRQAFRRSIALPADDAGVFSAIGYAFENPAHERTLHVDQYGGRVVSTYGYDDYPALAKVVAQGIGLHEGRRLGTLNFWLTTAFCLAVIFLSPARSCGGAPARRPRSWAHPAAVCRSAPPALAVLIVALAVFLPLFGITLAAVLLLDQLVLRRLPSLGTWFNVA